MTSESQIVFRTDTGQKVELDAIAEVLDVSSAEIMREVLSEALPKWRDRANSEVASRENLSHGVTNVEVESALNSLLRQLSRGESFSLPTQDLLTPKSKALWVLLGYLWDSEDSSPDSKNNKSYLGLVDIVRKYRDQVRDKADAERKPRK